MINNKRILSYSIIFILIFIFINELIIGGTLDVEEYYTGIFSINFFFNSISNYFLTFFDGIGPGMELPLGQGPFLFPTSFLLLFLNFKNFLIITICFCLLIQIYFFNKILKYFNKAKFNYLHAFLIIFSLPNFSYLYFNDWYTLFINYTFFTPVIYYLILIKNNNNFTCYLKLTFFLMILFVNSHIGYLSLFLIYIIIFVILNNMFFLLKDKYFYLFLSLIILSISDMIYHLYNQYSLSILYDNFEKKPQIGYVHFYEFKKAIFYPFYIIQKIIGIDFISLDINYKGREPFAGIQLLISILYSLKILFFRESKKFYYINIIFLFMIFLMTRNSFYLINFVSAIWQIRDIVNLLSLILFFLALNYLIEFPIKKFLKNILVYPILFLCIITSLSFIYNFKIFKSENYTNLDWTGYLSNTNKNNLLEEFVKKIETNNQLERIYFGNKFYNSMLNKFEQTSLSNSTIISFKDFVRYDLKPFNILSKNSINIVIREPNFSFMHQWIYPIEEEVSNRTFNQLFHIKYFLEFRSNINKYNLKDYEIEKVLNIRNDQLILFKNKYFNAKLYFDDQNFDLKTNLCPTVYSINCILENLKTSIKSSNEITFKRIDTNKYIISNNSNEDKNIILPFTLSNNWKLKENNVISKLQNKLMYIKIEPNKKIHLYYFDTLRYFLKIISLITFFILVILYIYIIFKKSNKHI